MSDPMRRYLGLSVAVDYDAKRCIHVAECLRGLPAVFDTTRRPWILPNAARADAVNAIVQKCPSGALHCSRTDGGDGEIPPEDNTIVPQPRGALHVRGRVELRSSDGTLIAEDTRMALCRCGQSKNKPFCDNSHRAARFDDAGAVADGGVPPEAATGLSITALANGPLLAEGALILRGAGG